MSYFNLDNPEYEKRFSGWAQFVLLLSIYPILFDFSLFSVDGLVDPVRVFYITDRDRILLTTIFDIGEWISNSGSGNFVSKILSFLFSLIVVAILMGLFIIPYVIALITSIYRLMIGWIFFGLILAPLMYLNFRHSGQGGNLEILEIVIYWMSKAAFLWFVFRGRVFSKSFRNFVITTFILTPIFVPMSFSFSSLIQLLLPIISLMLATLFIRIAYLVITENFYFFKNLGLRSSFKTSIRTVFHWWPMLLLAIPYFTISYLMHHAVEEWAYSNNQMRVYDTREPELRRDVLYTMANYHLGYKKKFDRSVGSLRDRANDALHLGLPRLVDEEFVEAFPEKVNFEKANASGWFKGAKNFAISTSHKTFNAGYGRIRSSIRARLKTRMTELDSIFQENGRRGIGYLNEAQDFVDEQIIAFNAETQIVIWSSFAYLRTLEAIGHMLFILICIKSYLYVLSRIAFNQNKGTFLTLGKTSDEKEQSKGKITDHGPRYALAAPKDSVFFVARKFQAFGVPPVFSLPQFGKAPIARLIHRAIAMNRVEIKGGEGPVNFSAPKGAHFVDWELREGETILFDFQNFVAMEESVRISTLISTRLTTLILGNFIFSRATGPGRLVLLAEGPTQVSMSGSKASSLPPERILAMHEDVRYHVDSSIRTADLYLGTAYLVPYAGGQAILDVDSQRGGKSGLARFIKHFLWPG